MIVDGRPTDYQPEEKGDEEVFQEIRHFLATDTLIMQIPRLPDKFPTRATSNDLLTEKADQVRSTLKFQINNQIVVNTQLAAAFLASLLKKNWQNIKVLYLKSTWDPPCRPSRLPLGYSISSSTCDIKKISDTEQLIPKESEKVKISEKESKNTLSDTQVLKMSQADSPATKDNKVKKLVENESNKDITSIITTLIKEHYWQWYNEKRPAEEIHNLLGLPTGPALLKSPYVWFWLDYTIWVGRENMVETLNLLRRMFGGDDELAIMFWQLKQQTNLSSIPANVTKLKIEFLEQIRVTFTKEEIIELLRSVLAKLKKLNRLQPFKDPKNLNLLKYLDRDELNSKLLSLAVDDIGSFTAGKTVAIGCALWQRPEGYKAQR
ncbi:hypothetical protein KXD40_009084 [Peronospora effusa]|nr:hypothetical protein KXD40_009084 [Peronospora effusa]